MLPPTSAMDSRSVVYSLGSIHSFHVLYLFLSLSLLSHILTLRVARVIDTRYCREVLLLYRDFIAER